MICGIIFHFYLIRAALSNELGWIEMLAARSFVCIVFRFIWLSNFNRPATRWIFINLLTLHKILFDFVLPLVYKQNINYANEKLEENQHFFAVQLDQFGCAKLHYSLGVNGRQHPYCPPLTSPTTRMFWFGFILFVVRNLNSLPKPN